MPTTATDPRTLPDAERLESLRRGLDDIHERVKARMGDQDVRHVRRLHRFSRACEVVGRLLIHVSMDPITLGLGVVTLWLHKQLQATEIGHPVLHGCYDKLDGAEEFRSTTWTWHIPIDEEAWHKGHNLRHHPYTNVAGRDPDIAFGPTRLNRHTEHRWFHYVQVPFTLLVMWPTFTSSMNLHFSGVTDLFRAGEPEVLPDRSWRSAKTAVRTALRKYVPYYGKELVLFPLLAGPFWWKVAAANLLTELMRDLWSAASIYCGHIGPDLDGRPRDTQAKGRAAWYLMQLEETQDYEVPYVISVLCGGLDRQIEHHLFPKLPPDRLREIAPEVRALCEAHGAPYHTGSWGAVLARSFRHLWELSFPDPAPAPVAAAG